MHDLLERCRSGDEQAWSALVERFSSLVYSIPRRYGMPEDQCEDIFQLVFFRLLEHVHQIRDADRVPKWLMTTTHRECWRLTRMNRREHAAAGVDTPLLDDDVLEVLERRDAVRAVLGRQSPRCRELLTALFMDPEPPAYDVLAERLGMPRGSLGPTRARCLARLLGALRETVGFSEPEDRASTQGEEFQVPTKPGA